MDIIFEKVMPLHLKDIDLDRNSIWGNSFQITSGKKVVLNASSGKGKTTFTTSMAGIRNNYEGEILFGPIKLSSLNREEWSKFRTETLSVVYQDLQLFPDLTVMENLKLKNSLTNSFKDQELLAMLAKLGIENKAEQQCSKLSLGQQQRVAIIRALCQPFQWLILDEPFSHLDQENARKSLELINDRCDQLNAGFILTTLGDFYGFEYDQELKL